MNPLSQSSLRKYFPLEDDTVAIVSWRKLSVCSLLFRKDGLPRILPHLLTKVTFSGGTISRRGTISMKYIPGNSFESTFPREIFSQGSFSERTTTYYWLRVRGQGSRCEEMNPVFPRHCLPCQGVQGLFRILPQRAFLPGSGSRGTHRGPECLASH